MKRKIDWLNHALEFLVIVIGILLAFQLEKCHNSNQQQDLIDEHRNAILDETEFNVKIMTQAKDYSMFNLKRVDSLIGFIYAKEDLQAINTKCMELLNLGQCYIKKNAYNNLIKSGDIRYLKDFDEKSEIIALNEFYKWVEAMDKVSLDSYIKSYNPYVMKHLNMSNPAPIAREVYEDRIFLNSLGSYRHTADLKLKKYNECLTHMKQFLIDRKT